VGVAVAAWVVGAAVGVVYTNVAGATVETPKRALVDQRSLDKFSWIKRMEQSMAYIVNNSIS
jgi:hypothetical protein